MKRIKGFTLIELLVVLAIIAFLAAVLLQSLAMAKYVELLVVTALVVIAISASLLVWSRLLKLVHLKS